MEKNYVVFDVETPNRANDRICSIGISIIDDGIISNSKNYLVNPECSFDSFNVGIHGIAWHDVKDAATFPEVWRIIRPLFLDRVVVAHNACFDLSVLGKTLSHYGIEENEVNYIDTVRAAKTVFPNLQNYKLDTLCCELNIELNHHDSGSDARATAELLLFMCREGLKTERLICKHIFEGHTHSANFKQHYSLESCALVELGSILSNITRDGKIDSCELIMLSQWIGKHGFLAGNYPFDAVFQKIEAIVEDGIIEEHELEELFRTCRELIDPVKSRSCGSSFPISVSGKNIVLSGNFTHGSKADIEKKLIDQGALIQKGVTGKTDIVLVGANGNDAWVAENYGTKVKKALELQAKGSSIIIVKESDYFEKGV